MTARALLDAIASHAPDRPALIRNGRPIGYGALRELAQAAAAALRSLPAGEPICGDVAVTEHSIATVLAALRSGHPILLPSDQLPPETFAKLAAQAGVRRAGAEALPVALPDDTAFLLTTSGSTGVPKIVPVSGGALDRFTAWAGGTFRLGPGNRVLSYAPLNFDLSVLEVWSTLRNGGCVVVTERADAANGGRLAALVRNHEVTVLQAVPMLYQLLALGGPQPSVRQALYSGYSMPPRTLGELPALLPNAQFFNVYGLTEVNDVFVHEFDPAEVDAAEPVPLGGLVAGAGAVLLDPHGAELTGPGVGELWVSTPFQTRGYLDPALNPGRFAPRPGGTEPWFRTGDLVHRAADGTLTLRGRVDFRVKVRGVQVNIEEVERVLMAHQDVAEAAVVAVADDLAGHRLHATVRTTAGSALNGLTLRRHCTRHLVAQALPASIRFLATPLPRTSTGKIDRARLRPPGGR